MAESRAVHDLVARVIRRLDVDARVVGPALLAPLPVWRRVLGFEGCTAQLDHRLRASALLPRLPDSLRRMLRDETASALRRGVLALRQLADVAALAHRSGIPILVLKGAARLLAGEEAGARSMSDVDLMVRPKDGARFHRLLVTELGYASSGPAYPHHLPVLERAGSLNIDVHMRLSDAAVPLDTTIWSETRRVAVAGHELEVPSATNMVLHVLEHGIALNWMGRYRLRDVLDIATLWAGDASSDAIRAYVAQSPDRAACETLLSAAHEIDRRVPTFRAHAWRTITRISRTRLTLASVPRDPRVAERAFRYAGVIAEGSPRAMLRAGRVLARQVAAAIAARRSHHGADRAHVSVSAAGGIVVSSVAR